MAAQAEVLVQVADVLGDAARGAGRRTARRGRSSRGSLPPRIALLGERLVEARRPVAAAGIAEVAAGAVARILPAAVSRASRPYLRSWRPNVESCEVVPWNDPW